MAAAGDGAAHVMVVSGNADKIQRLLSMRRTLTVLITLSFSAFLAVSSAAHAAEDNRGTLLAEALDLASAGSWTEAQSLTGRTETEGDVIAWLRLREGLGSWADYADFLDRNADWPNAATLRRHAERAMPADLPTAEVLAFFDARTALTGTGALNHAAALNAVGRNAAAEAVIRQAWRDLSMGRTDQDLFLKRHAQVVAPLLTERLDRLLWKGLTTEAAALLPLAPAEARSLAEARIAVRRDLDGSTAAIRAVPAALRDDPGLAYERYLFRVTKGRWDDAADFLLERSTSAEALGRPDLWMERRANLARAALRAGEIDRAYALAANNFGNRRSGADYADAEWVAGYIALTRKDDPRAAAAHFRRFGEAVFTPISLGRAGYWLGRAEEASGNADAARAAFADAARHQTSFYGQLAAERIGMSPDPALGGGAPRPDWRRMDLPRASVVDAAHLLMLAGDDPRALQFLRHAADGMDAGQRAAVAQLAADLGRPHMAVRLAKDAAARGIILADQYYPLHDMIETDWPVPTELALAIARQESEFNPRAVSPAGARGLMQLMPATAREVAGQLNIPYEAGDLTADPLYNARLGTAYLARMLDAWDGSIILAAAAYNAGPGRVRQWLETYGDPRTDAVGPVDWIEGIPFEETRNYVMRVLEGLHVYRARLAGTPQPLRLGADLDAAS